MTLSLVRAALIAAAKVMRDDRVGKTIKEEPTPKLGLMETQGPQNQSFPGEWPILHSAAPTLFIALAIVAALVPVWISPVLVTTDGPSHVYNAVAAQAVYQGREPFVSYLKVDEGVGPNRMAGFLLSHLGPILGWEFAERVLVTIAIGASFAIFLLLIRVSSVRINTQLAFGAAWLAQSWFVWMGFYDFSLSVSIFAALLLVLEHSSGVLRHLSIQVLLGLIFLAHLFTLAVAVGLVVMVFAYEALLGKGRWFNLFAAVPALVLLMLEVGPRGVTTGGIAWSPIIKPLAGLVVGDFVISFHPIDLVAGVLIMAGVWSTVVFRFRAIRMHGLAILRGSEVAALTLLLFSILVPDRVGEGSYITARMRFLATVLALPSMSKALAVFLPSTVRRAGTLLLLALIAHGGWVVYVSQRVSRDLHTIDQLVTRAGVIPGSWVQTDLSDWERGLYRISGYRHLTDRASAHHGLLVLDNYEAYSRIFPVKWRATPDGLSVEASNDGCSVALISREIRWSGPVFVFHESKRSLGPGDRSVELGPTIRIGDFAVTSVSRATTAALTLAR